MGSSDSSHWPIRCKFCMEFFHQIKNCSSLASLKGKSRKMGEDSKRPYSQGGKKSITQRVEIGTLSVNINKETVEHQAKGGEVDPKTKLLNKQLTLA